jgi:hypothetical protein
MPTMKKRTDFATSDDGMWCKTALETMEKDGVFYTPPSFTANVESYPDNVMPFVTAHMNYLMKHADVNPQQYISNLRLRSRKTR